MINKEKQIIAMNNLNVKTAYTKTKSFRWLGIIPDDVELVAPFPNIFISEKNIQRWLMTIDDIILPEEIIPIIEPIVELSLEEILKPKEEINYLIMSKEELDKYAETLNIKLDRRKSKSKMITDLEEALK